MNLEKHIRDFMKDIADGKIEVYNEFSLQHELGIFLRERIKGYKIQFERNASYFDIENTIKHEIDISIFTENNSKLIAAIELKYPRNGQYPESMFSFVKDIMFMEQVNKGKDAPNTYCLTLVDDKLFYSGRKKTGIYEYFRGGKAVQGQIDKSTGSKEENYQINGNYIIKWEDCGDKRWFYLLSISGMQQKE